MQVVNPVFATILHLLRTAATFCMGIVFLHLAHREPEIKFYAFYAGAYASVMGAFGLLGSRAIYRNALAKKNEADGTVPGTLQPYTIAYGTFNEATKPQSSAETAPGTTGTEGVWEDEKLQGVPKNADMLV